MQPFVIALASDSAEDSDSVACVTDHYRSVKHGPIANAPPDVEHLVFGSPVQSASTGTWWDVVQFSHPMKIQNTSLTSIEVTLDYLQFCF